MGEYSLAPCPTMRCLCLCVVALVLVSGVLSDTHTQFKQFKAKYSKVYDTPAEERLRYGVFLRNLAEVEAHNSKEGSSYSRGINEWSDLTQAEWSDIYLGGYKHIATHSPAREDSEVPSVEDLPANVDWRDEGVISAVKNQGQCGSCWAFGTTEQIESYAAIASGNLVELSTQQVTSCAPNTLNCGGNGGCMGSTPPLGYSYIQLFGQVSEADYPYVSGTTTNDEDSSCTVEHCCSYDVEHCCSYAVEHCFSYSVVHFCSECVEHCLSWLVVHSRS